MNENINLTKVRKQLGKALTARTSDEGPSVFVAIADGYADLLAQFSLPRREVDTPAMTVPFLASASGRPRRLVRETYGDLPLSKDSLQHLDAAYAARAEKEVALQLSHAGVRLGTNCHRLNLQQIIMRAAARLGTLAPPTRHPALHEYLSVETYLTIGPPRLAVIDKGNLFARCVTATAPRR